MTILTDPECLYSVFSDNDLLYGRSFDALYVFKRLLGRSIIAVDGQAWRDQHKIFYKAFTADNLLTLRPIFFEKANALADSLLHAGAGGALRQVKGSGRLRRAGPPPIHPARFLARFARGVPCDHPCRRQLEPGQSPSGDHPRSHDRGCIWQYPDVRCCPPASHACPSLAAHRPRPP